jgi:hypothetical protein
LFFTENLQKRLADPEERVREQAVAAVTEAAAVNPANIQPAIFETVLERLRDRKVPLFEMLLNTI